MKNELKSGTCFVLQVSLEHKNATVIYDQARHTPKSLADAIEDMGFESSATDATPTSVVQTETGLFPVSIYSTGSISQLRQVKGVLEAKEKGDDRNLAVTFIPALLSVERIQEMLNTSVPMSNSGNTSTDQASSCSSGSMEVLKMRIEGMTCLSCTTTIEGKIGKLKGVQKIKGESLSSIISLTVLKYAKLK